MNSIQNHSAEVRNKLEQFTKRYYLNGFFQSLAVYVIISILLTALLSVGEYLLKNSIAVRTSLFYVFLLIELSGLIYLIILPLMRYFRSADVATQLSLSKVVGNKNKEVDDKLLNILMLSNMQSGGNDRMLLAAIEQKSKEISSIPFHLSASFKKGLRFLNFAALTLALLIVMGMSFPDVVDYGTKRIIYYDEHIEPPAPFRFISENQGFAIRNEQFTLTANVEGDVIPAKAFIELEGDLYPLSKKQGNAFSYTFNRVEEAFEYRYYAEGYYSEYQEVELLDRPTIVHLDVQLTYPKYLGKENEVLVNTGNLKVPEGTKAKWIIQTEYSSELGFGIEGERVALETEDELATYQKTLIQNLEYSIIASSTNGLKSDSINYSISVYPDKAPSIQVEESRDSLNERSLFYGLVDDDYGLSSLRFVYAVNEEDPESERLDLRRISSNGEFIYEMDWASWNLKKGDRVSCYFEVYDNDGFNGSKSARSQYFTFGVEDHEELIQKKEELSEDIEKDLEKALEEAEQLNDQVEKLRKDLIDKKKMDWNEKRQVEDLLRKNEQLREQMDEIRRKNERKKSFEQKLNHSDEIMQKSEELQELLEEVMNEELLEMLKELEELMEQMSKDEINDNMEDIQMSNEQLEKELDRSLELFRQLEFEMKLEESINELDDLSKAQEDLQKDIEENGIDENHEGKQEELNEEFEEWQEEFKELQEKNDKLENKHALDEMNEERSETKESMEKAKENIQKNQKKNAGKNQQDAKDKMNEMSSDMKSLQADMQSKAMEDLQSLRNTLENLVELSFNQEELMNEMQGMNGNDPRFNDLTRDQRGVLDGLKVVEDSLSTLSKRIVQLESTINREVASSKMSMEKSIKSMTERDMRNIQVQQQRSMTSLNNLAVLLDEVVDQIQQQMMQSSGQCQNPGMSKPSSSSMQQLQKQLNDQIEQMKKAMEKGEQKGKKPGQKNAGDKAGEDAESLAKMAAEQAKIREELRKMQDGASEKQSKELKKIGELMEETERDIVNRQITRETLLRQEKILTRLLEAEDAEREQDMEKERESFAGEDEKKGNLLDLEEYYRARNAQREGLMKENLSYERYYEERVEEYFKIISE